MKATELSGALRDCRAGFVTVAVLSGLVNILYLTSSFFMMQVYDRVLPSRSLPTLAGLLVLALGLYAVQGLLDLIRARILARFGAALDHALSERLFDLVVRAPLKGLLPAERLRPLRDLDALRSFLGGMGPIALFDLPWMPAYLAICFLFHPMIGLAAVFGAVVLVGFTIATDRMTARATRAATEHALARNALADAAGRNAEALAAMGMQDGLGARWTQVSQAYRAEQLAVADVAGGFGAASKAFRPALQSGVLALGAFLVIDNQASAGVIIAASILTARAMAPAELAIANWKAFVQARQAWRHLNDLCRRIPAVPAPLSLPVPCRTLVAEAVSVAPPGVARLVVQDLSFRVTAGQGLGIIGPSASGKSTLARALVGIWPCLRGRVQLDGASLDQWTSTTLGRHVGYLPQEVDLFSGTVAQNIARFQPEIQAEAVIEAAQAAGVHEMIVALPKGYETPLGESGAGLSAGQRQRIGLARALFGRPFLVVLDEPNANLDAEGEAALTQAILGVRARGGICIVVAHRPSALAAVDLVLIMAGGQAQAFGPKDTVLKRAIQPIGTPLRHPAAAAQTMASAATAQQGGGR
jgi:PrtD family type I secretion system ABC transporter